MLGFYNYTVILTYLGMLISFAGMVFALNGNMLAALICLMISGVCDMFDGKIASTKVRTVQEKRFGIQIDSLSDIICFGVLPAIIVYTISCGSLAGACISGVYLLCSLIRLAYFNVDEEERQSRTQAPREHYLGLPITTAALALPALMGLGGLFSLPLNIISPIVLLIIAIAFITPFHLKKPGLVGKILLILCGVAELIILLWGVV